MQYIKFDRFLVATETGYGLGATLGEAFHNVPNLVDEDVSICLGTSKMIIVNDAVQVPIGEPAIEFLAQFTLEPADLHKLNEVGIGILKDIFDQKQRPLNKEFVLQMIKTRDAFVARAEDPQLDLFRDPPLTIHRQYGINKHE